MICPRCGSVEIAELDVGSYQCAECLKRFGHPDRGADARPAPAPDRVHRPQGPRP
jgi:ribosomal protein L37AE/L43A